MHWRHCEAELFEAYGNRTNTITFPHMRSETQIIHSNTLSNSNTKRSVAHTAKLTQKTHEFFCRKRLSSRVLWLEIVHQLVIRISFPMISCLFGSIYKWRNEMNSPLLAKNLLIQIFPKIFTRLRKKKCVLCACMHTMTDIKSMCCVVWNTQSL